MLCAYEHYKLSIHVFVLRSSHTVLLIQCRHLYAFCRVKARTITLKMYRARMKNTYAAKSRLATVTV